MSRVLVFDLGNRAVGEFEAQVTRGWALCGSTSLQGGLQTTIDIPEEVAEEDWLQFGRMVLVESGDLPAWAGMIDPPWKATSPVQVNVYGPEYLLALRTPEAKVTYNGVFRSVLQRLVDLANQFETLNLKLGNMGTLPGGSQQLTVDQVPLWQQLNDFGKREAVEFYFRPEYQFGQPLTIYIDAGQGLGIETGIELHDGAGANMQVVEANVEGVLTNRMIGIGRQSTSDSRPQTVPFADAAARALYRFRNTVEQFSNLIDMRHLEVATQRALEAASHPKLILQIAVTDHTLDGHMRPGNVFFVHATQVFLPGGIQGWRGRMRMIQMAYEATDGTVVTTMEARL